jgi:hypothetical protein
MVYVHLPLRGVILRRYLAGRQVWLHDDSQHAIPVRCLGFRLDTVVSRVIVHIKGYISYLARLYEQLMTTKSGVIVPWVTERNIDGSNRTARVSGVPSQRTRLSES